MLVGGTSKVGEYAKRVRGLTRRNRATTGAQYVDGSYMLLYFVIVHDQGRKWDYQRGQGQGQTL